MFNWWDTNTSIALVGSLVAIRFIGQPAWDRYIAWHLRVRHHIWCFPLSAAAALIMGGIALSIQQIRLGELLILSLLSAGALSCLLVGAGCPKCRSRLRYRPSRFGHTTYHCHHCGYEWTGWPLKDTQPD